MKNNSFKTFVAIVTFVIGVLLVMIWVKPSLPMPVIENVFVAPDETEEYAVYSVVLNELFFKDNYKTLIISDKVSGKNSSERLKSNFNLAIKYVLVNEDNYDHRILKDEKDSEKDKKPDLIDFFNKQSQPIAFARLSRVVLDENKTTAEVEVSSLGFGKRFSLGKSGGSWKIVSSSELWIS